MRSVSSQAVAHAAELWAGVRSSASGAASTSAASRPAAGPAAARLYHAGAGVFPSVARRRGCAGAVPRAARPLSTGASPTRDGPVGGTSTQLDPNTTRAILSDSIGGAADAHKTQMQGWNEFGFLVNDVELEVRRDDPRRLYAFAPRQRRGSPSLTLAVRVGRLLPTNRARCWCCPGRTSFGRPKRSTT